MSPTQPPINYIPEAKSVLVPDDQPRALALLARILGLEHAIWGPVCGAQTDKRRDVHSWCGGTWDVAFTLKFGSFHLLVTPRRAPSADMTVILAARGIKACSLSGDMAEQGRTTSSSSSSDGRPQTSLLSPYCQSPKLFVIHPTRARHKP
ncbi:hypothetical protein MYCTH_2132220 [Thermothelomyces thermophilus ATCC 42464]|uniref:Uncharacterized protein n=1 Tax=Thermothelomyces thermophilus (strain ATCC 42464 / BCRC 31852 / DSM 1799) TaxID=573729 RepID=G2Q472_THET4|nr:uncharacterized protein MYCTH_2132220 [Thermothelomyces thermophilus ATCC 42464]AEO54467.1 hypothetical protein MYCTH_2132220 [Thermothelomyces thermophilus ATCC 42464]